MFGKFIAANREIFTVGVPVGLMLLFLGNEQRKVSHTHTPVEILENAAPPMVLL